MRYLVLYILFVCGCSPSVSSEGLSGEINSDFTICSGDGLTEKHIFNAENRTHTIVYNATGKDSFWFNDYGFYNMHSTFMSHSNIYGQARTKSREFIPSNYLHFDEYQFFAHSNYRKLVLSINGKDTLLDSIPYLSKRNWVSPSFRKTRVVDYRPRSRYFPIHDIPEHIREKYDFRSGLIKETYVDSNFRYDLILNARSKDTLYYTSRKCVTVNKQSSLVIKEHFDAFLLQGTGTYFGLNSKYVIPPITQETLYNNGELSSDKAFLTIKGKDYVIYSHQFSRGSEVYTTLNRMRVQSPHDTMYPTYNFKSDTIFSYDYRKYSSNEIAPVISAMMDTTSDFYIGEKVWSKSKDSAWYQEKYIKFGTPLRIQLPYWYESDLFQYRYYGEFHMAIDGIKGIHLGYVHYLNGDRPYGSGELVLPYGYMQSEKSDPSHVYPAIFIKRKEGKRFIESTTLGFGGLITDEYHSADSVWMEIFAKHNWLDRKSVPKNIHHNAKKTHFSISNSWISLVTPFGKKESKYQGYRHSYRKLYRKDVDACDSFSFTSGESGVSKRSLIERPNYFENIAIGRTGNSYSVYIKQIERCNRYLQNTFRDKENDYSFILSKSKTGEHSITKKLYSYIPMNYPVGEHIISHSWDGHKSNIIDVSYVGTEILPGKYIAMNLLDNVLEQSNKRIIERWSGDTLTITERTGDSKYKIILINGIVHSIDYITSKDTYHLVFWKQDGDKLQLKNTYEKFPNNIKKMLENKTFEFSSIESEDYKCQSLQKYALMHYLRPGLKTY
jgi:hypothetical protein